MTWKTKHAHGNAIDGGITATFQSQVALERRLKAVNGSGFDELDAVELSLECREDIWEQDADQFGDPLELAMRAEEEEDDA